MVIPSEINKQNENFALSSASPKWRIMGTHPYHPLGGAVEGSLFEVVLSSANRATIEY